MHKIERIHWVDTLRGLAIVFMVVFHFAFDYTMSWLQVYDKPGEQEFGGTENSCF